MIFADWNRKLLYSLFLFCPSSRTSLQPHSLSLVYPDVFALRMSAQNFYQMRNVGHVRFTTIAMHPSHHPQSLSCPCVNNAVLRPLPQEMQLARPRAPHLLL